MPKIIVLFDSQTGFTEKMAEAIVEGAKNEKDVEAELLKIGSPFSISKLDLADAIIIGSPVIYGNLSLKIRAFLELLKKHIASNRLNLSGKIGGAFGSYAFSGGWVIQELSTDMEALGITIVVSALSAVDGIGRKPPVRIDEQTLQRCHKMGRVIADKVS